MEANLNEKDDDDLDEETGEIPSTTNTIVDVAITPPMRAQQRQVFPGAEAVDGPDYDPTADNDDYTTTAPPSQVDSIFPVTTATLVQDSEEDVEALREELERIREDRDNAPRAQVVPDDDEARPDKSLCQGKRKWIGIVTSLLVVTGIVLGIVLPTMQSPPDDPTLVGQGEALAGLLSSVSFDDGEALRNPFTPQNQAYNWLLKDPSLGFYSNKTMIQRYVLATLYYSANGDSWTNNTGWLSDGDECDWSNNANVSCSNGSVVVLDFHDEGSESGNELVGTFPNEVALLSNTLVQLDVGRNRLSGTVHSEIGLLTKLDVLTFHSTSMRGTIPSQIGQLTKLTSLSFSTNQLTGTISSEIGLVTNLESISLRGNSLIGTIPGEFAVLTNLDFLNLGTNMLTGTIMSEIGKLTNLSWLALADNRLSGTIPTEFGLLTKLDQLRMYRNDLTGAYTCPDYVSICKINCTGDVGCRSL